MRLKQLILTFGASQFEISGKKQVKFDSNCNRVNIKPD